MSENLTREMVVAFVKEAIERKGEDHISPLYYERDGRISDDVDQEHSRGTSMCRYVTPNGEPGCIVGQVLHSFGVPLELMAEHEGRGAISLTFRLREAGYCADDEAENLLAEMQDRQDVGNPWGTLTGLM